jgi:hypothetical protein
LTLKAQSIEGKIDKLQKTLLSERLLKERKEKLLNGRRYL